MAVLFLVHALPAQAQWQRKAATALRKGGKYAHSLPVHSTLQRVLRQRQAEKKLYRSLCSLCPAENMECPFYDNFTASGFVLEETFQGKTYRWGVTVSHYNFQKPYLQTRNGKKLPILLLAQGAQGHNDISLFALPQEVEHAFIPMHLATEAPRKGDKLHSFGFFENMPHHESARIVQQVSPHRIITSLQVENKRSREGACGGPVLNEKNEVVGVHAGSSQTRQLGFVLPAQHIQDVLTAYHTQELAPQDLVFNGHILGQISINQAISSLALYKGDFPIHTFFTLHNKKEVDYAHLEDLLPNLEADKVVLFIEQTPFSQLEPDQRTRQFTITYHLKTGQITTEPIE